MAKRTIEKLLKEHMRGLARKGGKARAKKYDAKTLRKWGKLGGRPRKDKRLEPRTIRTEAGAAKK